MTADNSIFPFSNSRTTLVWRINSLKAKMFIFLSLPCPPWHEIKRVKIVVITQQRGMACRGHWGQPETPVPTALGPPPPPLFLSHTYMQRKYVLREVLPSYTPDTPGPVLDNRRQDVSPAREEKHGLH